MNKIWTIEQLVSRAHWRSRRVVLCLGCFDWAHPGHIRHLQAAKQLGEALVVVVTADRFAKLKGPGRPIFNENERAEMLAALSCTDFVAINPYPTAVEVLKILKPHFYAKGSDTVQSELFQLEVAAAAEIGCKVVYTDEKTFHTTDLIARLKGV